MLARLGMAYIPVMTGLSDRPFFSVIVPTHDRPRELQECLTALTRLTYPVDRFEVIVVDDGSPREMERVVGLFRDRLSVTLLAQPNAGPATARNTGAASAKGIFLAFTDDDCRPHPNWLQALGQRLRTAPDDMVGGRTLNSLSENIYSTASQQLILYLYDYYDGDDRAQRRFFAANNLCIRTELFHRVGGFDTSFQRAAGEDRELSDRWLSHGYRMVYAPEAVVYHAHVLTLHTFWRQHLNYGRGAFRFHELRKRRSRRSIEFEPLSFYLNLLRYPFSQTESTRALRLMVLLLVSQAANAAGYLGARLDRIRTRRLTTRER